MGCDKCQGNERPNATALDACHDLGHQQLTQPAGGWQHWSGDDRSGLVEDAAPTELARSAVVGQLGQPFSVIVATSARFTARGLDRSAIRLTAVTTHSVRRSAPARWAGIRPLARTTSAWNGCGCVTGTSGSVAAKMASDSSSRPVTGAQSTWFP